VVSTNPAIETASYRAYCTIKLLSNTPISYIFTIFSEKIKINPIEKSEITIENFNRKSENLH
jgi:hypothetical protein